MARPDRTQRTLAVVVDAGRVVTEWLAAVDPDPATPTVLPGWDVATLVAHLAAGLRTASTTLGAGTRAGLTSVGRYLAAYGPAARQIADRDRRQAADLGWPGVRDDLVAALAELTAFADAPLPERVAGPRGVLKTPDFLATRVVELVVHADDLGRSIESPGPVFGRAVVTMAVRSLTEALGDNHPGHTIEVRVPPHAAVQCGIPGDGPTHTRGTPPNVVETDAPTFLRLATGRVTWREALAGGTVSASGIRADLSTLLPLW